MPPKTDQLEQTIRRVLQEYMKTGAFTDRKLTDTPTDNLQVVNRRFVTNNGTLANRPTNPVAGQMYYSTSSNTPIWYNGTAWTNASGSVVAGL